MFITIGPTLRAFRQIGIKLWMLTGDHPYTAVSIAHSCELINNEYTTILVTSPIYENINQDLIKIIDACDRGKTCMVITGEALGMILSENNKGLKNLVRLVCLT